MNRDKKHDIALMRYSTIAPIISRLPEEFPSMRAYFRAVAQKGVITSDGSVRYYSAATIERWYFAYKKGGFDALLPASRSDAGKSRKLDDALQEQIRYLKTHYPRMSAASIYRQLRDDGSIKHGDISESTVCRYINQMVLDDKSSPNQDMRRYERAHINEVWCGDSSAGPYLKSEDGKKHRVYIIALIDDASRFITGINLFFHDNFINLMSVMKSAVSKYGRPDMFNFDNGSSYKNKQMELLAARIGTVLNYCKPYSPTAKAKVERWFRTMKDQWMASLDMKDFHSIEELRGSLTSWVNIYNNSPHSSLNGKTPSQRFFEEPAHIHRLSQEQIDTSFLLEVERTVSADNVVSINQVEYEVHYRFAKQRIRLRYSPDMKDIFVMEADGSLSPIRLLNKQENAVIKREKVHLCKGENS